MPQARDQGLLRLSPPSKGLLIRSLYPVLAPVASRVLRFSTLNDIYAGLKKHDLDVFLDDALATLGIDVQVSDEDAARIPKDGPLLVVANHPFGGVEGVIMASILRQARPDVRLMTNYMLSIIPELAPIFIGVDPFGSDSAAKRNIGPLKESLRWLKEGHCLGVFPAGEVSSLHLRKRSVVDPRWHDSIGRIARKTKATVLPVYFVGRNSILFQILGLIHPRLRTAMLPREMLKRRHSKVEVRIGTPLPASKLAGLKDDEAVTHFMRTRTYILAHRGSTEIPLESGGEPIAPPQPREVLEAEMAELAPEQILFDSDEYLLFIGGRAELPQTVRELGRLREATFREVGEGTGRAEDLDEFDGYYSHLVLWHKADREIVGSYRIGPTDEILSRFGAQGLYTNTLFKFKLRFLKQITPALELGRSFVRSEYQKSYAPLLILWKGIAAYVARNPHYRFLFGPVSISNSYTPFSRSLLVKFLNTHARRRIGRRRPVKAKTPPKVKAGPNWKEIRALCESIEDLGAYISEVEGDQKGVPVLLRQYLKLGGKIMAFNVDPDFANALDGLILVDLTATDPKILAKYMGQDNATAFLRHHGVLDVEDGGAPLETEEPPEA